MVPTGGKALPGWVIRIRGPDSASAAHQRSACPRSSPTICASSTSGIVSHCCPVQAQAASCQPTEARASAAHVEQAGRQLSCHHQRQHTCHLSPHRGARQRRSQRSPRRASRATAQLPPPKAAHVPSLATQRRSQRRPLASSEHGSSPAAATRRSTRAASRHTVARASVEASAARIERVWQWLSSARIERAWQWLSCRHRLRSSRLMPLATAHHTLARASVEANAARIKRAGRQPSCHHPRQHMCRLSPHRGARQRRSQRSPHRASRATAQLPPPEAAHEPLGTPWLAPA